MSESRVPVGIQLPRPGQESVQKNTEDASLFSWPVILLLVGENSLSTAAQFGPAAQGAGRPRVYVFLEQYESCLDKK